MAHENPNIHKRVNFKYIYRKVVCYITGIGIMSNGTKSRNHIREWHLGRSFKGCNVAARTSTVCSENYILRSSLETLYSRRWLRSKNLKIGVQTEVCLDMKEETETWGSKIESVF